MKKIFSILTLVLTFVFQSYSQDLHEHICIDRHDEDLINPYKSSPSDVAQAVVLNSNLWTSGQTIRIKFLNGDTYLQDKVRLYAGQWLQFANLKFQYVAANEDSDIKISFRGNGDMGNWSAVGTGCRGFAQFSPSMNFGAFNPNGTTAESVFSRVILHEFGHALGMTHEHHSPVSPIQWNTPVVYEYYARTQRWSNAQTFEWVIMKYNTTETNFSAFDPLSIMTYYVPPGHTLDGYSVQENNVLSATDKSFMAQTYPPIEPLRYGDNPTASAPQVLVNSVVTLTKTGQLGTGAYVEWYGINNNNNNGTWLNFGTGNQITLNPPTEGTWRFVANVKGTNGSVIAGDDKFVEVKVLPLAVGGTLSPISNTYVGMQVDVKNTGFSGGEPVYTVRNESTGEYIAVNVDANLLNKQFGFTPNTPGSYVVVTQTKEPLSGRLVAGNMVRFKVDLTPAVGGTLSPISNTYVGMQVNVRNTDFSGGEPVYSVVNESTGVVIANAVTYNMLNKQFGFTPNSAGTYVIATYTEEPNSGKLVPGNTSRFTVDATPAVAGQISTTTLKNSVNQLITFSNTGGVGNPIYSVLNLNSGTILYDGVAANAGTGFTFSSATPGGYAVITRSKETYSGKTSATFTQINIIIAFPIIIKANPLSKVYGSPNLIPSSAIIGTFTPGDFEVTYLTSVNNATGVGVYTIIPSVSGSNVGNYDITIEGSTFTVTPAPLTISVSPLDKVYGSANPLARSITTGLVEPDAIFITYIIPTTSLSGVGVYPISAVVSGSALSNYTLTIINTSITITPAPLRITSTDSRTKVYGQANPVFSSSVVGLVGTDIVSLSYSTLSNNTTYVGSYPVITSVTGTALTNYDITVNSPNLVITPAPLMVKTSQNSYTKVYGINNPIFTGSIVSGLINNDAIEISFSSATLQYSNVGTYSIIPQLLGAAAGNYKVLPIATVLDITPAPLKLVQP